MIRLVLLSAVAAGCAGSPRAAPIAAVPLESADAIALRPWSPPNPAQRCVSIPTTATGADAVADSAALRGHLLDLPVDGHLLLSFGFDTVGQPRHLLVLEATMPEAASTSIVEELWRLLRPQEGALHGRLRIDLAGEDPETRVVRMRLGGTQYCAPLLRDAEAVEQAMGALRRRGTVELSLSIDTSGAVTGHEVIRGSGLEATDRVAIGLVTGLRYEPAYFERRAVPARIVYTVDFR